MGLATLYLMSVDIGASIPVIISRTGHSVTGYWCNIGFGSLPRACLVVADQVEERMARRGMSKEPFLLFFVCISAYFWNFFSLKTHKTL